MKKILIFACFFLSCISFLLPAFAKEANLPMVMVCGQAEKSAGEKVALEDAKKEAVSKVLARHIAFNESGDSVFQQMLTDYDAYVGDFVKVIKKEKKNNKILLFCKVPVDFERVKYDLEKNISMIQNDSAQIDDEVFFFIRIKGLEKDGLKQGKVMNWFGDAFQQYGFNKATLDNIVVNKYDMMDYIGYKDKMVENIKNDVSISIAVVGEIEVLEPVIIGGGVNAECICRMNAYYYDPNGELLEFASFSDNYTIRRSDADEAENLVLQKAAYNSSKSIADLTLEFWNKRKQ